MLFHQDQPPAGLQPGVELLQVILGQLVQRDMPDLRDDVLIDPVCVALLSSDTQLRYAVGFVPECDPVPEGHVLLTFADRRGVLLLQNLQLFQTFFLGFAQYILGFRQALVIVTDDHTAYFKEIKKTDAGRVLTLKMCENEVRGADIREKLDLRSACFDVKFENDAFTFTVYGYGHGVGMSQYGANYMAKQGNTYKEILGWYYKGCSIAKN